jgi:hypothetical protein
VTEDLIRARRFELVDDQERPRAALHMEDGQPILTLADEDGSARVQVAINREGNATLRVRDAAGQERIQIAAMEDGTGFVLTDSTGAIHVSLLITENGEVLVSAQEHEQNRAIGYVVPGGTIMLGLWDAEGNQTHGFGQGE